MEHEYRIAKKEYKKEEISYIQLLFDNGDYLHLSGEEIDDIAIRLYDKLILAQDKLCAVAESGFLKLSIQEKLEIAYNDALVYNPKQLKANRKAYIENRIVNECGIIGVRFFDENNWHTTVFGNVAAKSDGNAVIIEYLPKPFAEPYENEEHIVFLNNIKKSLIGKIFIDFENCEGFSVYADEIIDIHLNFKSNLEWVSHDYGRVIENGYMIIKIDDNIDYRDIHFHDDYTGKISKKTLERRLCDKKNVAFHDICHLYIDYYFAGFGLRKCECLEINDIKSDEEIDELIAKEEDSCDVYYQFEGGRCERQKNGTIKITFGK